MRGPSDERLVERVRRGDDRAFEALFERHHRGVLSFCRHVVGSADEAEDAAQQAFIRALAALRRDDRPVQLRPWLYGIARNRCLSMLERRRELPVAEHPERAGAADGLAAEVARREELRLLVADVAALPEAQRAALVLAQLGELSHDEIAEVLGVRREKVKALVFQARTALLAQREARDTPCAEVRETLATAAGGMLRRGPLRRHLRDCEGCRAFGAAMAGQRAALASALPAVPSAAFAAGVLGAAGAGTAAAAAGAGLALSGTAAKVAAVVALAGAGGGAGTVAVSELSGGGPPAPAPAVASAGDEHGREREAASRRTGVARGGDGAPARAVADSSGRSSRGEDGDDDVRRSGERRRGSRSDGERAARDRRRAARDEQRGTRDERRAGGRAVGRDPRRADRRRERAAGRAQRPKERRDHATGGRRGEPRDGRGRGWGGRRERAGEAAPAPIGETATTAPDLEAEPVGETTSER